MATWRVKMKAPKGLCDLVVAPTLQPHIHRTALRCVLRDVSHHSP
jgi:hypothetical protein